MFSRPQNTLPRESGQSLSEYAMGGALIVLAVIAALVLFGGNLSNLLTSIQGAISTVAASRAGSSPATTASGQNATLAATGQSSTAVTTSTAGTGQVQLTTTSGTVITLPNYPVNITQTVTTAGANGTTELLASSLESLAQQLLASHELTPTQYNALIDLANQGHKMAEMEGRIETLASNSANIDEFAMALNADPIVGPAHTGAFKMGYNTGYVYDLTGITYPLADQNAYGETKVFQDLYQTALDSGAMADPTIAQFVENLGAEVAIISGTVSNVGGMMLNTESPLPLDSLNQSVASQTSHLDSSGICAVGNGTSTGVQCLPGA